MKITFTIHQRKTGYMTMIYVDDHCVEKRQFYDRQAAQAWAVQEIEARSEICS